MDEKEVEHLITYVVPRMELDVLLPVMKEMIAGQLTEDHITAKTSVKTVHHPLVPTLYLALFFQSLWILCGFFR